MKDGKLRGKGQNGETIVFNPENSGSGKPSKNSHPTIYINGKAIRYNK
jgi:hypothetical protein